MSTTQINQLLKAADQNCKVFMMMKIGNQAQVSCNIINHEIELVLMSILSVDKVTFV